MPAVTHELSAMLLYASNSVLLMFCSAMVGAVAFLVHNEPALTFDHPYMVAGAVLGSIGLLIAMAGLYGTSRHMRYERLRHMSLSTRFLRGETLVAVGTPRCLLVVYIIAAGMMAAALFSAGIVTQNAVDSMRSTTVPGVLNATDLVTKQLADLVTKNTKVRRQTWIRLQNHYHCCGWTTTFPNNYYKHEDIDPASSGCESVTAKDVTTDEGRGGRCCYTPLQVTGSGPTKNGHCAAQRKMYNTQAETASATKPEKIMTDDASSAETEKRWVRECGGTPISCGKAILKMATKTTQVAAKFFFACGGVAAVCCLASLYLRCAHVNQVVHVDDELDDIELSRRTRRQSSRQLPGNGNGDLNDGDVEKTDKQQMAEAELNVNMHKGAHKIGRVKLGMETVAQRHATESDAAIFLLWINSTVSIMALAGVIFTGGILMREDPVIPTFVVTLAHAMCWALLVFNCCGLVGTYQQMKHLGDAEMGKYLLEHERSGRSYCLPLYMLASFLLIILQLALALMILNAKGIIAVDEIEDAHDKAHGWASQQLIDFSHGKTHAKPWIALQDRLGCCGYETAYPFDYVQLGDLNPAWVAIDNSTRHEDTAVAASDPNRFSPRAGICCYLGQDRDKPGTTDFPKWQLQRYEASGGTQGDLLANMEHDLAGVSNEGNKLMAKTWTELCGKVPHSCRADILAELEQGAELLGAGLIVGIVLQVLSLGAACRLRNPVALRNK